jgi:PIN domain nuclease of toxin-antitoxin system
LNFLQSCPDGVVLDANFVVSLIEVKTEARRFAPHLKQARISTINLGEAFYILRKNTSSVTEAQVEQALTGLGVTIDPVPIEVPRMFNYLKSIDKPRIKEQQKAGLTGRDVKSLSLGDLTCLGFAAHTGLPVLTGDMHWFTLARHGLTTTLINYWDLNVIV